MKCCEESDLNLTRSIRKVVDQLRWTPELGGLKVAKGGADVNVTLKADAGTVYKASESAEEAVTLGRVVLHAI